MRSTGKDGPVSGVTNVSPADVVKRTAIPMARAMVMNLVACAIFL